MLRIALVALLCGTCMASAETPPNDEPSTEDKCGPITAWVQDLSQGGGKASFMTMDELKRATVIYNLIPPPSDSKWDFAVFFDNSDESGGVMFGAAGEVCKEMGFDSPDTWEHVKKAIIGGQSI